MSAATDRDIAFAVLEFNPDPVARQVAAMQCVATLQARAALAGHELVQMSDGSFVACKPAWGVCACLADIEAVERWLQRVGAPA